MRTTKSVSCGLFLAVTLVAVIVGTANAGPGPREVAPHHGETHQATDQRFPGRSAGSVTVNRLYGASDIVRTATVNGSNVIRLRLRLALEVELVNGRYTRDRSYLALTCWHNNQLYDCSMSAERLYLVARVNGVDRTRNWRTFSISHTSAKTHEVRGAWAVRYCDVSQNTRLIPSEGSAGSTLVLFGDRGISGRIQLQGVIAHFLVRLCRTS